MTHDGPEDVPQYLAARIRDRLAEDVHELGIRVEVRGGVVHLRGDVVSEERRREVAAVAGAAAEGREVRNEVSVVPVQEPEGEEGLS